MYVSVAGECGQGSRRMQPG